MWLRWRIPTLQIWFSIFLIISGAGEISAQQRKPSQSSTSGGSALPLFSTTDIGILRKEIARVKPTLEGSEKRLAKRLEYLAELTKLLALAEEIRKEGADATSDLGPLLAPRWPALSIETAVFGDLRNNHVCDATPYLTDKCKLRPAAGTDDYNCLIATITPGEICGLDPSPQAKKQIYVEWSCGGRSQAPARVPASGPLRLICHVHSMQTPSANVAAGESN